MIWFFLIITAVFFIVFETVLEKRTLSSIGTLEFAAMFAFGNAIVLSPFLLVADLSQLNPTILLLIYVASIVSTTTSLLIFKTMKHSALSEAAPILALLPLVVTLLAFLFLGEKVNLVQIFGLILIVVGIMFLEFKNFETGRGIFQKGRKRYILYILLCLLFGGLGAIFDRVLLFRLELNSLTYLAIIQIFIALNYLFFLSIKPKRFSSLKISISDFWKIIFLISLLTVAHRYLYASAIKLATSIGLVVAVYKLSSLFNVFVGEKFFGEKDIVKKIIATLIILSGVFLLVIN
ncbi:MAG: EamA family transporter [Patescibacteria group bacterium]